MFLYLGLAGVVVAAFWKLSRDSGLFLCGLFMMSIQMILAGAWVAKRPPMGVCGTTGAYECLGLAHYQETFFFTYAYPLFLGVIICVLCGLSWKWKSNSGASWNLFALVATFTTWIVIGLTRTYLKVRMREKHSFFLELVTLCKVSTQCHTVLRSSYTEP